jgi:TPR repeat protein
MCHSIMDASSMNMAMPLPLWRKPIGQRALNIAVATLVCVLGSATALLAGPLDDAKAAHERQDYAAELQILRPLANKGDAVAQYLIGVLFENGFGVPRDYVQAVAWFRKAAAGGDTNSKTTLGLLYANGGFGVRQEGNEALSWHRKAAEHGEVMAPYFIGSMYFTGQGVSQDYSEAAKWYRKAAEQGQAASQYQLGQIYEYGIGVMQNYPEAAKWYRKAADQGVTVAKESLASMYEHGKGVPQDNVLAYMWYNLAVGEFLSENVRILAVQMRDGVTTKMTPAEIAEAQKLSREWKPQ